MHYSYTYLPLIFLTRLFRVPPGINPGSSAVQRKCEQLLLTKRPSFNPPPPQKKKVSCIFPFLAHFVSFGKLSSGWLPRTRDPVYFWTLKLQILNLCPIVTKVRETSVSNDRHCRMCLASNQLVICWCSVVIFCGNIGVCWNCVWI